MSEEKQPIHNDSTFNEDQFQLVYSADVEKHFWNIARNHIVERQVRKLLQAKKNDYSILDVGCGTGVMVKHLRENGLPCIGVEVGTPTIENDIEAFVTTATMAADLPKETKDKVDVILLLDVIEHVEKPALFLKELASDFPSVRHFIITVPARQELWSNYDEFFGHFLRYDTSSIQNLAVKSGLSLTKTNYLFQMLYPVFYLIKIFYKKRSLEMKPPRSGFGRLIHRLAGSLLIIEERIPLLGRIWGTSLYSVLSVKR